MEFMKNFRFQMSIFFRKCSMIFQISLIKFLIHKIKEHKNFQNFLTSTDRRNWIENVKNIKKTKKTNSKLRNCEKKNYFTYLYYCKRTFRNFKNSLIKSLFVWIKHYKKFHNFLTSLDRWNKKKMPKMLKKKK